MGIIVRMRFISRRFGARGRRCVFTSNLACSSFTFSLDNSILNKFYVVY